MFLTLLIETIGFIQTLGISYYAEKKCIFQTKNKGLVMINIYDIFFVLGLPSLIIILLFPLWVIIGETLNYFDGLEERKADKLLAKNLMKERKEKIKKLRREINERII